MASHAVVVPSSTTACVPFMPGTATQEALPTPYAQPEGVEPSTMLSKTSKVVKIETESVGRSTGCSRSRILVDVSVCARQRLGAFGCSQSVA
jgi:hypothetical protein